MRLLRADPDLAQGALQSSFFSSSIPPYAILSHTWSVDSAEEVTLQDVWQGHGSKKPGFTKILGAMRLAKQDGLDWVWIDTCCIDKTSSVELSEAINSMFSYYQNAEKCYAYLADVSGPAGVSTEFLTSRWFKRGWTLQELIAPKDVVFITKEWQPIGTKHSLDSVISGITAIDTIYLTGMKSLSHASIAKRMCWASTREVTRAEDSAYSLIGIFGVKMYMLYGEGGDRAFARLQEEILKTSEDQSIFAWSKPEGQGSAPHGLLADSPKDFAQCWRVRPYSNIPSNIVPVTMTAKGLNLNLPLTTTGPNTAIAALHCPVSALGYNHFIAIYLVRHHSSANSYARIDSDKHVYQEAIGRPTTVFVVQNIADDSDLDEVYPNHIFLVQSMKIHTDNPVLTEHVIDQTFLDRWTGLDRDKSYHTAMWLTVPTTYRITKQAGKLCAALRIKRRVDGYAFVLLMGALTDFEVGFDVSDDLPLEEESKAWGKDEWQTYWQHRFHPEPPGTYLPLIQPSVRVNVTTEVKEECKWYHLQLDIHPVPAPPSFELATEAHQEASQDGKDSSKPRWATIWKKPRLHHKASSLQQV